MVMLGLKMVAMGEMKLVRGLLMMTGSTTQRWAPFNRSCSGKVVMARRTRKPSIELDVRKRQSTHGRSHGSL
jgi:hypothetical protein